MRPDASPKRRDSSLRRPTLSQDAPYQAVYGDVSNIIDAAKDTAARSVNAAMTTAYWLIGHRIVEFEQSGEERAEYGTALIESLAEDLTGRFGRGFSRQNLQNMRLFYLAYPPGQFSRHCLANSIPHPSRWASTTFSRPFRWPGGHTAPPVGQERERPPVLRGRGAARKVVGPQARLADQLRFSTSVPPPQGQGRHAHVGREGLSRGPGIGRGGDQGLLRPGVPRPQGRVLRERP